MPVLSLACHLPHNTPNIPSRYNNEQTTKQTKAINNSYIYIYISHVNVTQTVPDISPLMPMHQDPLLVLTHWCREKNSRGYWRPGDFLWIPYISMHAQAFSCGISMSTFKLPHEIYYSNIHKMFKCLELLMIELISFLFVCLTAHLVGSPRPNLRLKSLVNRKSCTRYLDTRTRFPTWNKSNPCMDR